MDRLGEINVPTFVMAGREHFVFPPQSQRELATGIPHAQLKLIDRAGHNPYEQQTAQVLTAIRQFISISE
jgi:proline iminopeptidase